MPEAARLHRFHANLHRAKQQHQRMAYGVWRMAYGSDHITPCQWASITPKTRKSQPQEGGWLSFIQRLLL